MDGGLDLAVDKVSGLRIGMDLVAGLEKPGGGGGQISALVGTQGNMGVLSIGQVCGGSRRGVNWRIRRGWMSMALTLYSSHILTTVSDQIAHVIAKGSYSNHSMVV